MEVDIASLVRKLTLFHNRPLRNKSYEEIKKEFFKEMKVIPDVLVNIPKTDSFPLYRGSRANVVEQIGKHNPISYSNPPSEKCNLERANYPGFPVFYACENPLVPMLELRPKDGDIFYLSKWKLNKPIAMKVAPFLINYNSNITNFKEAGQSVLSAVRTFSKKSSYSADYAEVFVRIITEWFLGNNINLSAFIAHIGLYDESQYDLIIYPSIATSRTHVNYALLPDFANDNFHIEWILAIKIREFNNVSPKFRVLPEYGSLNDNNSVVWQRDSLSIWLELVENFPFLSPVK